ncbi:TorF family putative porin [Ferrimonas aestuarii]|uniref:Porin n=1 Tax=Ferrimonas aestuarii TaxID=2569539 RepID=A0A4U1BSQ0_9GAMM|nr:TorF family putative porin [Ferrimonas aestuarii]TKB56560.1 hypothetical protein FCL42_05355 [Ferrimonas aestuarii]
MKTKLIHSLFAVSTLLISGTAMAALDANVGLTSNYLFRGLTQTDDGVALQGGIDYSHDSGIYVGTWASNVDFGDDTSYEIDFYGGYAGAAGELSYDLGYVYYAYPDAGANGESADIDFGEAYLHLGWKYVGVSIIYATNTDDGAEAYDSALYYEGNFNYPISDSLSVGIAVGQQDFDKDNAEDYLNYNLSLTKTTELGDITFMVSDTDLDNDDPKVIIGWGYAFSL